MCILLNADIMPSSNCLDKNLQLQKEAGWASDRMCTCFSYGPGFKLCLEVNEQSWSACYELQISVACYELHWHNSGIKACTLY